MIHLFFSIFQTIIKIILKHSIKNTKEKHDVFVSFLTPMHQLTWVTQWIGIIFEGVFFQSYTVQCGPSMDLLSQSIPIIKGYGTTQK